MSFFGEIVEPTSRTAWEDWDEIESARSENNTELKWKNKLEEINKIETFFIFDGKYLSDCIETQTDHELQLINTIPEANLSIFREKGTNRYICSVRDYNIVWSSNLVELLQPYITCSDTVITIQAKPLALYQSTEPVEDCVIRTVCTSKPAPIGQQYPKLEQPNMISGVTAGAIFLREQLGLSGAAFACFMEYPVDNNVNILQQLMRKLNILQDIKVKPNNIINSNLYI